MEAFISPKLEGQRFAAHSVPLDMLKDFAALQEMLVEVAKWRYLQDNPGRQRTPRYFTADFELTLTGIRDGSAILEIGLLVTSLFTTENQQYLERAKADIVQAVAAAEAGQQPNLPPRLLSYFDRFGRGLRENESITIDVGDIHARLDSIVRDRLVASSQATKRTSEVTLFGRMSKADARSGLFELETLDGQRLSGPLKEPYVSLICDAVKTYESKTPDVISVQGVAEYDLTGRWSSFEAIEHVTLTDVLDIDRRIAELELLRNGWHDGEGIALDREALRRAGTLLRTQFDPALPPPRLYPTLDGRLRAEWSPDVAEVSLEIELSTFAAEYSSLDLVSGHSSNLALDLSRDDNWTTLNEALRQLMPEGSEDSRG